MYISILYVYIPSGKLTYLWKVTIYPMFNSNLLTFTRNGTRPRPWSTFARLEARSGASGCASADKAKAGRVRSAEDVR